MHGAYEQGQKEGHQHSLPQEVVFANFQEALWGDQASDTLDEFRDTLA